MNLTIKAGGEAERQASYIAYHAFQNGVDAITIGTGRDKLWEELSSDLKVTLERDFSIIANRGGQFSNGVVAHKDYLNDGPMYLRAAIRSDFIGIIANISNAWKEEYDMDKFKDKHGWGEGRNYFLEKIAQRKGKE